MGKSYSRRTAGVTEKKCDICVLTKKHTQMQHLNESQRYTIYRMRKDKKTQSEIAVESTKYLYNTLVFNRIHKQFLVEFILNIIFLGA